MFGPKQQLKDTPLRDKDPFVARGLEPRKGLEPRMLLDDQLSDPADHVCGATDLLIQGLVDRLPGPDSIWSLDSRAKWLRTAASIFGLVYKTSDGEDREINIVFSEEEAANQARAGLLAAEPKEISTSVGEPSRFRGRD